MIRGPALDAELGEPDRLTSPNVLAMALVATGPDADDLLRADFDPGYVDRGWPRAGQFPLKTVFRVKNVRLVSNDPMNTQQNKGFRSGLC